MTTLYPGHHFIKAMLRKCQVGNLRIRQSPKTKFILCHDQRSSHFSHHPSPATHLAPQVLGASGLERSWEVPECSSLGVGPREAWTSAQGHTSGRERMLSSFPTGNSPKSQGAPPAEPWTRVPRPLSAPGLTPTELISLTAVGPLRRPPLPTCHHQTRRVSGQRAEVDGKGSSQRSGCWSPLTAHPASSPRRWSLRPSSACIVQPLSAWQSPALLA